MVFLRPPPPLPVRGCGAQRRRKNFKWTLAQGVWLQKRTHNLKYKSIPFPALTREAENRWGYAGPQQENIQNRIKGREKAVKERRPPPAWVTAAASYVVQEVEKDGGTAPAWATEIVESTDTS